MKEKQPSFEYTKNLGETLLTAYQEKIEKYEAILEEYEKDKDDGAIGKLKQQFATMLDDYKQLAKKLSIETEWRRSLEDIDIANYQNIQSYFAKQKKEKLIVLHQTGSNNYNDKYASHTIEQKAFEEQDKELIDEETQTPKQETKPKYEINNYEINNTHNIQILEQQKPEYIIDKTHDIKILNQKQPKAINKTIHNISFSYPPTKKATNKKNTKFHWKYPKIKHKENKDLWKMQFEQPGDDNKDLVKMQFERLGDKGWRNPSNLMLPAGKSPFRDYDKNRIKRLHEGQEWQI